MRDIPQPIPEDEKSKVENEQRERLEAETEARHRAIMAEAELLLAHSKLRLEKGYKATKKIDLGTEWAHFSQVITKLSDQDPLVTSGALMSSLHELFYNFHSNQQNVEYGSLPDQYAFTVPAAIVEKMGNNPENLPYLERIFQDKRVPGIAIQELVNMANSGYVPDEYTEANYYRHVIDGLAKIKTPEALRAIEKMLAEINKQNSEYLERTREPLTDEDKIHTIEHRIQSSAGLLRSYEYTQDWRLYVGYKDKQGPLNHLEPHPVDFFDVDIAPYQEFFGPALEELDPRTKELVYAIKPRLIESVLELKRLGKYRGLPPEEIIDYLQNGPQPDETDLFEVYERSGSIIAFHEIDATYSCGYFKEHAIEVLGKVGDDRTIDVLKNFIVREGDESPIYFDKLLEAFRGLDQNKSVRALLELARSRNDIAKKSALALLYRIEAGQIGVSEDGAYYLQKVFDIGTFNDSSYYVQRITGRGQVGIFERSSKKFAKYFELEGLDSEQSHVRAQLMDLTYATLFTPKENETIGERKEREVFLAEFQEKYFGFLNGEFFDISGVRFNDLSFTEQAQFMKFYQGSNDETKARVVNFCQKFGLNGFRVFLSVDYGAEMGNAVLRIGDTYKPEVANKIFAKYGEIVSASEDMEASVRSLLSPNTDLNEQNLIVIKDKLLRKAKDLLVSFSSAEKTTNTVAQNRQIAEKLHHIKTEILLFASTFKALSEREQIDLAELANTHLEIKDSANLSEDEKRDMDRIFADNRKGYSPTLFKETREEFQSALQAQGKEFQVLRVEGTIIAFIRFDQLPSGNLYAGSLNVRPEVKGSAIGSAMLRATLNKKAQEHNIEAVVYSKNPMLKHYTSDFGFQIAGEIPDYNGTGELFYRLFRPKQEQR